MTLPKSNFSEYPRAIVHIDGDAFFAACEIAKNPALRGKPVVVGSERGIACAMSYEAKARGVTRAMPAFQIKKVCPEAIFCDTDFDTYKAIAEKMYAIVRRYTPDVEEYSIDECFADITGMDKPLKMTYEEIATAIKKDLQIELGITYSVGLSVNKVLAKIGSKHSKPNGLTFIPVEKIKTILEKTRVEKIWGIGPKTSECLHGLGIFTGWDLAQKSSGWLEKNFTKPTQEIYQELLGDFVLPLNTVKQKHNISSVSRTNSFTPPSNDKKFLWSELSKNAESACSCLREQRIYARKVSFFIKTQDFRFIRREKNLPVPTCFPQEILSIIKKDFDQIFDSRLLFRTTGIILHDLQESKISNLNLFEEKKI